MTPPARYRKKPVEVEAVQWTGENIDAVSAVVGRTFAPNSIAEVGDWIGRRPHGVFSCSNSEFEATYEPVDPDGGEEQVGAGSDALAGMRPASRGRLALEAAVLQCIEAEVWPATIREVVESALASTQQAVPSTPGSSSASEGEEREPSADEWACDSCGLIAPEESDGWEQTPMDDAGVTVEFCPHCKQEKPWPSCRGSREIYVGSGGGYGSPGSSYMPCARCPDCRDLDCPAPSSESKGASK